MNQETYNLVSTIAICIGFAATIITLLYVRGQILVNLRTRETDVLIRLYQISTSQPLYNDFDIVWDINNPENLTAEQRQSALRACLFFEMVGAVASEKYINTVLIEEYFGSLVTGCYDKLHVYLRDERQHPYNNNFGVNLEKLAWSLASSQRVSRALGRSQVPAQPAASTKTKQVI